MTSLQQNPVYQEDLRKIATSAFVPWEQLQDSSVLLSGATGMIGSLLVDTLLYLDSEKGLNCKVYAISRNAHKAEKRFAASAGKAFLHIIEGDVTDATSLAVPENIAYVLHLASNTHPVAYATDPIGTITTNIIGTRNMLDIAARTSADRFLFASSNEIYGEALAGQDMFGEHDLGYIDCNTLRAGYPESKRCGESLCQAFRKQKGLNIAIARLTRSFGPSLLPSDTKAMSQFLGNAIRGEDIVLKSAGKQYYSYTYAADAVTGLMTVLMSGEDGEAYNIADASCDIRLKDLAALVAKAGGTKVRFDIPSETEAAGFSKATKARLDGSKLMKLGWRVQYDMPTAINRTLSVLKDCCGLEKMKFEDA